jgi:hypothetical protein
MKPLTKREIFFEALEMPTPESRAAYLQAACGDDVVLRRKIDELLKEHQTSVKRPFSVQNSRRPNSPELSAARRRAG